MKLRKGDKITVCSIGRRIDALAHIPSGLDCEALDFHVINASNDWGLQRVLHDWAPNVIVTFGDWRRNKILSESPEEIRRRWINLDPETPLEQVGQAVLHCYLNAAFTGGTVPLVSVFTPTCEPGPKLFRPLQSLLDQTYANWEWILLDDSDDDGQSFRMLVELSRMDHRIKAFKSGSRSGRIGQVKREACALATGSILVELDHDDELTADCLSWLVRTFQEHPQAGMTYTDCAEVMEETFEPVTYPPGWGMGFGSYRTEVYRGREYSVTNYPRLNPKTIRHIVGVPNHVRAWRADTYWAVGGHNPDLHVADDYELIIRTFLKSRIVHVPRFGYIQFRNRSGNTTFNRNAEIQRMVRCVRERYDAAIHARWAELGIDDYVWTGAGSDLSRLPPEIEQHGCIVMGTWVQSS